MRFPRRSGRRANGGLGLALIAALAVSAGFFLVRAGAYMRELSSQIAISDAEDRVTAAISSAIKDTLDSGGFEYDYFVTLEKDAYGRAAAILTNVTHINTFSADILSVVAERADSGELNVGIPIGNLIGLSLTVGKGPRIPVDIIMLTSSHAELRNELTQSGINQTKHQIILEVIVDIDVLVPWETLHTQARTQALVAETVIVGQVPETYLNME